MTSEQDRLEKNQTQVT